MSSYSEICELLAMTRDARELRERLISEIRGAGVVKQGFRVLDDGGGRAVARPTWTVNFGPNGTTFEGSSVDGAFKVHIRLVVTEEACIEIINANFGPSKAVKTRGCKRNILLEGRGARWTRHGGKVSDSVKSFREHFTSSLEEDAELKEAVREATERVASQVGRVMSSPEYARAASSALCTAAVEEVGKTLKKFRDVPNHVLAAAVDEFVVSSIMDE